MSRIKRIYLKNIRLILIIRVFLFVHQLDVDFFQRGFLHR